MSVVRVFSSASENLPGRLSITSIVWAGATTAGDTVVIREIGGDRVWEGIASGTQTYLGISFPADSPLTIDRGIEFSALASGRVYLYVRE